MTGPGVDQKQSDEDQPFVLDMDCKAKLASGSAEDKCDIEEMCAKVKGLNESKQPKEQVRPSPSNYIKRAKRPRYKADFGMTDAMIKAHNKMSNYYSNGIRQWATKFANTVAEKGADSPEVESQFAAKCRYEQWKKANGPARPPRDPPDGLQPDHVHDVGLKGTAKLADIPNGIKWMNSRNNHAVGQKLKKYDPAVHGQTIATHPDCMC